MKRASLAGPVIKSVIFIVITATVTAILGISIAHSGVSATVGYQAVFSDVTGLARLARFMPGSSGPPSYRGTAGR